MKLLNVLYFIFASMLVIKSRCYGQENEQVNTIKANKQLMQYVVEELFNKGDTTVASRCFVEAFAAEEIAFTKLIRAAFPDLAIKVDIMIAEDNRVAARWIATGTHKGKFLGVAPTNKKVSWKGSWFWTFSNGKIVDGMGKGSWDALGLLQQLQAK